MPELQVEPPGADVPDPGDEPEAEPPAGDLAPAPALDPLRISAAAGAAALTLFTTGHVYVVAVLLAFAARTRLGAVAVLLAATAVLVRWGSPSLSAVAGAQSVLGPAVVVGSAAAAASTVFAAAAVVLAARDRATAAAFGLAAATIAAGPSFPHDIVVRLLAAAVGIALALAATRLPRVATTVAVACGAAALLLAAVA